MKFEQNIPPRKYQCGKNGQVEIADCGYMTLAANEQITFLTNDGREYDVAAKEWGFYATPSINGRLKDQGFKTALVRNQQNRIYVMLVKTDALQEFHLYLKQEDNELLMWLDEHGLGSND